MAQVYLTQAQERQAKAEKQLRIWIATQVTNQRDSFEHHRRWR